MDAAGSTMAGSLGARWRPCIAIAVVAVAGLWLFFASLETAALLAKPLTSGIAEPFNLARRLLADILGLVAWVTIIWFVLLVRSHRLRRPAPLREDVVLRPTVFDRRDQGRPRVAVGITAYNDAAATASTAAGFLAHPAVEKVIVVDNNSSDNTSQLALSVGAEVVRERRQGYGHTCIRCLHEAAAAEECDIVVLTEGDGTFLASDLDKFLAYIGDADMVVGTRVVNGMAAHSSQMDAFFVWGNIAASFLLRLRFWNGQFLGKANLTDMGCTYRAIRRTALQRILPDLEVGGMHFLANLMIAALSNDLRVVEVPIRFRQRVGLSKGGSQSLLKGLQVGLAMIWHVLSHVPPQAANRRRRGLAAVAVGEAR